MNYYIRKIERITTVYQIYRAHSLPHRVDATMPVREVHVGKPRDMGIEEIRDMTPAELALFTGTQHGPWKEDEI